ncbi:MAG: hypothetical protein NTW87_11370 [Planctomycetota bacterium]|nr:hypothetical protein [Planctomycetota bacterium]
MGTAYYHILTDEVLDADDFWLSKMQGELICPQCWLVNAPEKGIDVVLAVRDSVHVTAVSGIPVLSREFLGALGGSVLLPYLHTGRVLLPNSEEMPNLVAVKGKQIVYLRGRRESKCCRCHTCGHLLYGAGHARNRRYILRSQLRPGWPVYESDTWQLVVSAPLVDAARRRRWGKVWFEPIRVVDEPEDGFPTDLEEFDRTGR